MAKAISWWDPKAERPNIHVGITTLKPIPTLRSATRPKSTRCAREIVDPAERQRLWDIAVKAFPPYQEYQGKTDRVIPVFLAEPF
tara:strand:+ start:2349 stop:2603 length:255 start_codon:yes stop_codon:yes gene_type:complete